MNLLEVIDLSKYIQGRLVLNNIRFSYQQFQRIAIAGETGSGKTTLLKAIAGFVQPDAGAVLFNGSRVLGPDERLLPGHPQIAYLSQHFELRNNYKVADFLEMASKVEEAQAQRIYRLCRIDHVLQRKTDQLSGGERQRTALARLLTTSPRLLLLDEPFSNLDGLHKQLLKDVLHDLVEEHHIACIMVSHDPEDVLPWAEDLLVLKEGVIVQHGSPQQVYHEPASEYVGGLFGDYNTLTHAEAKDIFSLPVTDNHQLLFLRPENIRLQKQQDGNGLVTSVSFFGSFFEVELVFGTKKIKAKTSESDWKKGDRANASLAAKEQWLVAN